MLFPAPHRRGIRIHPRNRSRRLAFLPVLQGLESVEFPSSIAKDTLKRAFKGFCGVNPNFARSLPTDVTFKLTPNLPAISLRTTSRVHKPKSKPCWRGSLPLIQRKICRSAWPRDGAADPYLSASTTHASLALYPSLAAATDKSPADKTRSRQSPRSAVHLPTPAEPPSAGSLPESCDQAFAHRAS